MKHASQIELLLKIATEYSQDQLYEAVSTYRFPEVFYHFSPLRWNLISWSADWKDKKVLEIGSECGAYTSYLASQASSVCCLEASEQYQRVNKARHKDKSNVRFLTGNMSEVVYSGERYDRILITQAFSEAATYVCQKTDGKEGKYMPDQQMLLRQAASLLTENGQLILAVDNRMGLKYFAGTKDAQSGYYFGGIEGINGINGEQNFTAFEMQKIFEAMPDYQVRTYFPYPDYCYPKMIYSDAYLPKKGELVFPGDDLDERSLHLFNLEKAFDLVVEQGLFPVLSNSFMYIIERNAQ